MGTDFNDVANLPFRAKIAMEVISEIEGQNWTDHPLTEGEKICIEMAVLSVMHRFNIKETKE